MTVVEHAHPAGCDCDALDVAGGLLTIEAAIEVLRHLVPPIGEAELLPLRQATGRVLATPVRAKGMTPPFDNAAMDGYALCTADLKGLGPWRLPVAGRITAGDGRSTALRSGAVLQIFTGAVLPAGADAVVMQEDVTLDGGTITLRHAVAPDTHIRRAGEDMKPGDSVLNAGCRLGPRQIAALAAAGTGAVAVTRPVRVAILATGDELSAPGSDLGRAGIWDVNTPMLVAALTGPQIDIVAVETGRDTVAGLGGQLSALAGLADLIITTGGISVGAADQVKPALLAEGGSIAFSGVAIKPGKPVSAGRLGAAAWLALPGNPLSACVTWQLLGTGLVAGLSGMAQVAASGRRYVVADGEVSHRTGRCEARLASIVGFDGLGREVVSCALVTHSGRVGCLPQADGLILLPADTGRLPEASLLEFIPFTIH